MLPPSASSITRSPVYGTARTFARQLGREAIANELQETLDEEGNADKILTEIAESVVNVKAP